MTDEATMATPALSRHLEEITTLVERHASEPITSCALPRVTLVRADAPQEARGELFVPVVCLVVRGTKAVQLGAEMLTFTPGTFVVSALDFPITGHVVEVPYRAVAVHLSAALLADLLLVTEPAEPATSPGFSVGEASEGLADAVVRLLRLLDRPDERGVLAQAAEREVLFRALQTPIGHVIRQFALQHHLVSRVEPAITWIREHAAERLSVEALAELSHLSTSSLYRHFRSATGSTPLQFQKQIRLQEARKLLLVGDASAATAAARVGYTSAAQFSREYSRLFGVPPGQHAARASRDR